MSDEPKLGGTTGEAQAPDPYEAKYMAGPDGALYFAKMTAPVFFHLLFLLPLFVSAFAAFAAFAAHASLLVPLISSVPLFFVWILFSALRISVTPKEVHVQYGLFGPRVPIESIVSCEACDYDWIKYGGFGIRHGRDGSVTYNMLGDGGRAVRITYKNGSKTRTLLLSARDPERLAAAIQHARAQALSGGAPARFDEAPLGRFAELEGAEGRDLDRDRDRDREAEEEAPPISEKRLR